jgi:hypothetical protein
MCLRPLVMVHTRSQLPARDTAPCHALAEEISLVILTTWVGMVFCFFFFSFSFSFSFFFFFFLLFLGEISYSILMSWTGIFFMLYASSQVLIMMTAANAEESRSVSF